MTRRVIRYINEYDFEWLRDEMCSYGGWGLGALPSDADLFCMVVNCSLNKTGIILESTERRGFLSWELAPHSEMYPEATVSVIEHWYVVPEFRNGTTGYLLLKEFHAIMKKSNVTHTILSLAKDSEVADSTMCKLGYDMFKKLYIMEVI